MWWTAQPPPAIGPADSEGLVECDKDAEGIGSMTKPAQPTGASGSLGFEGEDWKEECSSNLGVGEGRVDGAREDLGLVELAREGGTECRGDGVGVALLELAVVVLLGARPDAEVYEAEEVVVAYDEEEYEGCDGEEYEEEVVVEDGRVYP